MLGHTWRGLAIVGAVAVFAVASADAQHGGHGGGGHSGGSHGGGGGGHPGGGSGGGGHPGGGSDRGGNVGFGGTSPIGPGGMRYAVTGPQMQPNFPRGTFAPGGVPSQPARGAAFVDRRTAEQQLRSMPPVMQPGAGSNRSAPVGGFSVGGHGRRGFSDPARHASDGFPSGVVAGGFGGFSAAGTFSDDHLRVAFHLGSANVFGNDRHFHRSSLIPGAVVVGSPFWGGTFLGNGWSLGRSGWYGRTPWYGPIDGVYTPDPYLMTQPAPTQPMPPAAAEPRTDKDLGDLYLQAGDSKKAVAAYTKHLAQYPTDAFAMRALGLAYLQNNKMIDAVAMIALAYRNDPTLAEYPLPPTALAGGAADLRDAVRRASLHANRVKTGSAWLTLAALMQAEGRNDLAARMIERGRAVGLEPRIADAMSAALAK